MQLAKEKKLQKLKLFCDYHLENRKIIIDRVYIPEYAKAFKVFEQHFQDSRSSNSWIKLAA